MMDKYVSESTLAYSRSPRLSIKKYKKIEKSLDDGKTQWTGCRFNRTEKRKS
jgi:hypothetical protein